MIRNSYYLFICFLFFTFSTVKAIDQPVELRCLSVAANGDVQITWVTPADACGSFLAHYIYASQNPAGPFVLLDSVKVFSQTTYTHIGATAANKSWYYYVITKNNCSGQPLPPSDTLQSIKLDVVNTGKGSANITWNAIRTPLLPTSSVWYRIFRELPSGTWTLIDSTQSLSYVDTIKLCSAVVNYRIEIQDASGCASVSSVDGDLILDNTVPAVPVLDSVSVDAGGLATMSWNLNPSGDTRGYVIYQFIGGVWTPIDTVYGITNISFTNPLSQAWSKKESYLLAALDSCGNISPLGVEHNTIYSTALLDVCKKTITLQWNSYVNWTGGVSAYEVWVSENAGTYSLLASVNGTTTSYVHTTLNALSTYCYIIRARDSSKSKSSSSNQVCIVAGIPVKPNFLYLKTATVSGGARVDFYVDIAAQVIEYRLLRADASGGPWQIISVFPASTTNPDYSYTDGTANTGSQSYFYQVQAIDTCITVAYSSNKGRTIYLEVAANNDLTNSVDWNDYNDWTGGVDYYDIYRSIDGVWAPAPVATVPGNTTLYIDDVSAYLQTKGSFCYYVDAVEAPGNAFGFIDTSRSNAACTIQPPKLYVPNAVIPTSAIPANSVFLPVTAFLEADSYLMVIFNRWGQKIFETTDRTQPWDVRFKGELVPEGVYVYVIVLTGNNGRRVEKRGSISVLR